MQIGIRCVPGPMKANILYQNTWLSPTSKAFKKSACSTKILANTLLSIKLKQFTETKHPRKQIIANYLQFVFFLYLHSTNFQLFPNSTHQQMIGHCIQIANQNQEYLHEHHNNTSILVLSTWPIFVSVFVNISFFSCIYGQMLTETKILYFDLISTAFYMFKNCAIFWDM